MHTGSMQTGSDDDESLGRPHVGDWSRMNTNRLETNQTEVLVPMPSHNYLSEVVDMSLDEWL